MAKTLILIASDVPDCSSIDTITNHCPNLPAYELWDVAVESKKPGYHSRLVMFCKVRGIREIYCWRLIALARGSIRDLLNMLNELCNVGTVVHILLSEYVLTHHQLNQLRSWELECKSLAQSASLARARAGGMIIGRPPKAIDKNELLRLRQSGLSYRQVAEKVGLSYTTVMRRLGIDNPPASA